MTESLSSDITNTVNTDDDYQRRRKQSLDATHKGIRLAKAGKRAFQPDDVIGNSKTWRFISAIIWPYNNWLHRLEYTGYVDELMELKDRGVLTIHMHTTHNSDIAFAIIGSYKAFGKVSRGLVHRTVMACFPFLANLGMVPGYRDTAEQLLNDGKWVAVIPGGGEEAMRGHENAYNLDWPKNRRGFAKVAIKTEAVIVPMFYQNMEEMRFNPVFWLWNKCYGSTVYAYILKLKIPVLGAMIKLFAELVWFTLAWIFGIPVPAKVTAYVGRPIYTHKDDDIDAIVKKTYTEFQALIHEKQPGGRNFSRAYNMWKEHRKLGNNYPLIKPKSS